MSKSKRPEPLKKSWRLTLILVIAVVAVAVNALAGQVAQEQYEEVNLTQLIRHVEAGDVKKARVLDASYTVQVELENGRLLEAVYPAAYGEQVADKLIEARAEVETEPRPGPRWWEPVIPIIPPLVIVGFLLYVIKSGALTGGKNKKSKQAEVPDTRFDDVAGVDEAKEDMKELVEFLQNGERYRKVGARPPKGALLVGPPGTGKTLLARAVAGEAGVPFFEVAGSDFVEKFAGLGAARVRELFAKAKAAGKAIIFIDEIDAAGRTRSSSPGDGAMFEAEGTLTALLTEIDGFEQTDVIVIGATNRQDIIDPALLRRLEKVVQVPLPDRGGRTQILRVHAKGRPFSEDVDWVRIGRQAFGMSGADLEKVINEACMEAARRGADLVTERDVISALSIVEMGRARTSAVVTDRDREITAWHEAGHAVVARFAENLEDPTFVTIIPRGASGGHTRPGGNDHIFLSKPEALDRLAMMMGGRAAEKMLLGKEGYTQGAGGDLQAATRLATAMITEYGMGSDLVQVAADAIRVGGEVGRVVNSQVDHLLKNALERAEAILKRHEDTLRELVEALLSQETLSGDDLRAILRPEEFGRDALRNIEDNHRREAYLNQKTEEASEASGSSENAVERARNALAALDESRL